MTFCCYELALDQDIQNRLRSEINEILKKSNGEVTYDSIMEMKYLDMVFNETLRKYPITDTHIRQCAEDFLIPNTNLVIPAGCGIIMPVSGIHNDPNYFENPEKFNPERFSEENIKKIRPHTYIPFCEYHIKLFLKKNYFKIFLILFLIAEGPRMCIGSR